MTVQEVAVWLREHDSYLILTHRRPDGDTLGCAAALCEMLRGIGKRAAVLYNPETTVSYAHYMEDYWTQSAEGFEKILVLRTRELAFRDRGHCHIKSIII